MKCTKTPLIPLRRLVKLNPKVDLPDFGEVEYLPMEQIKNGYFEPQSAEISTLPESLSAFSEGDILLAKVTPCFENGNLCIAKGLRNKVGVGSTELFVIRVVSPLILPEYLVFLFQEDRFKSTAACEMRGTGGLKRIPTDWLLSYKFPVPSLEVQHEVVKRLDHKMLEILELSQTFDNKRDLLEEFQKALIWRVVTKGLNPKVSMKDSTVSWIGNIPSHWNIATLGRVFDVRLGKMLSPSQVDPSLTQEDYLCAGNIDWSGVKGNTLKKMWFSESEKEILLLKPRDVLIVEGGAGFGKATIYKGEFHPCYIQNSIVRLRELTKVKSEFANFWLRFTYEAYLKTVCSQATFSHYTKEKVLQTPILVPPKDEQLEIIDRLSFVDSKINCMIDQIELHIQKLSEYRTALVSNMISEVGKL